MCAAWVQQILADAELNGDSDLAGRILGGSELEFFKQSMGARNRIGIELSYRPARLHRLAESIPGNRFLGSINV